MLLLTVSKSFLMFRVCGRSSLIILGGEGEEEEDDDGEEVEAEEGLVVEED